VDQAYTRAKKILKDNFDKLQKIANYLLEKESIDISTARAILGIPEPVVPKSEESAKAPTLPDQGNPNS